MNRYLLTFMISVLTLVYSPFTSARDLIVVGEAWPPFEFKEGSDATGIDVDIAKAIFDKMGIPYQMKILPWARAWAMVEKGEADAVFSTSRKSKREPYLYYPKEDMWTSSFVFFVAKDKKKDSFDGYNDAQGLTVGVVKGNSYNDDFWAAKLKTEESVDLPSALKKLASGRIDLLPADKTVGLYSLKQLGLQDKVTFYEFSLFSKGYPMPFAKKSSYPNLEEVSKQFEMELLKLKASGEYGKIREKWLGVAE